MSDLNSLRGAALAMTGIAAHLVAETTGRVEAWVDGQLGDDEEA